MIGIIHNAHHDVPISHDTKRVIEDIHYYNNNNVNTPIKQVYKCINNSLVLVWDKTNPLYHVWLDTDEYFVQSGDSVYCSAPRRIADTTNDGNIYEDCIGWYDDNNTFIVPNNSYYTPSGSISLTSEWSIVRFLATFNGNGGTPASSTALTNNYGYVTLPSVTHAGTAKRYGTVYYNFDGWFDNSTNLSAGDIGDEVFLEQDKTFIAHWEQIHHTATLNYSGSQTNQTLTTNADGEVNLPSPSWTGYIFNGWYNEDDDTFFSNGGYTFIDSDVNLYADWIDNSQYYTVTFDNSYPWYGTTNNLYKNKTNNNTYTSCSSISVLQGNSITLPTPDTAPAQTRNDTELSWTFNGWYTAESNFMGTVYSNNQYVPATSGSKAGNASASYTPSSNITLYGQWKLAQYTTTLYANTSNPTNTTNTNIAPSQIVYSNYDNKTDLNPSTWFTLPSGYDFIGWYKSTSSGHELYTTSTDYTYLPTDYRTLIAHWTLHEYTIDLINTLDNNVTSVTTTNHVYYLPALEASGWEFQGWYTQASGGTRYRISGNQTFNSDKEVYAQWLTCYYTINYQETRGDTIYSSNSTVRRLSGNTLQLPNISSKTDTRRYGDVTYLPNGWWNSSSSIKFGDKNAYFKPDDYSSYFDSNYELTMYAQYTLVTYRLTLNYNYNSLTALTNYTDYDGELQLQPATSNNYLNRSGYTFLGWYTASNGGTLITTQETPTVWYYFNGSITLKSSASTSYTLSTSSTIYAHWEADITYYVITYNGNGGTPSKNSDTVAQGSSVTLPSVTKSDDTTTTICTHYTFNNWQTFDGTSVSSPYTPTDTITLYAHYDEIEYLKNPVVTSATAGSKSVSFRIYNPSGATIYYRAYKYTASSNTWYQGSQYTTTNTGVITNNVFGNGNGIDYICIKISDGTRVAWSAVVKATNGTTVSNPGTPTNYNYNKHNYGDA